MSTQPLSLRRFALEAGAWFLVSMAVWSQISAWTSYPAGALAKILVESQIYGWVESCDNVPGKLTATTRFRRQLPDGRLATPIATVEPAHYAYGLNLFLALLLASRGRKRGRKLLFGFAALCLPQAISLVLVLLGQILREVPMRLLAIGPLQADVVVVGNMFGMLVLPTLAPVVLWLWMEWDEVSTVFQRHFR